MERGETVNIGKDLTLLIDLCDPRVPSQVPAPPIDYKGNHSNPLVQKYEELKASCLTDAPPKGETAFSKRKYYEAMSPVLFIERYAILVYARMVTPIEFWPSMLQKWCEHLKSPLLPSEREAYKEAIYDLEDILEDCRPQILSLTKEKQLSLAAWVGEAEKIARPPVSRR